MERRIELAYKLDGSGNQMVRLYGNEMPLILARGQAGLPLEGKRITKRDMEKGIKPVYAYPNVTLPAYQTASAVACDIACAEETVIKPFSETGKPTLVHTGLKVSFGDDEAFLLLSRSSTPKLGLILGNGVGVFESDYYENDSNDGEILVCLINLLNRPVVLEEGQRIAQGMFVDIKRAGNLETFDVKRGGGFGSTGTK